MYQNDAEVLFPVRVIHKLRHLRGAQWQELVERMTQLPETHPDVLGFSLMMIRLDGCLTCHADSYRAMRGCTLCAQQAIARFKGSDADLLDQWAAARDEILQWQLSGQAARTD